MKELLSYVWEVLDQYCFDGSARGDPNRRLYELSCLIAVCVGEGLLDGVLLPRDLPPLPDVFRGVSSDV